MKNVTDVLQQKTKELLRLQEEVATLRAAHPLLKDDDDPALPAAPDRLTDAVKRWP